jgi:arylsulfatase
MLLQWCESFDVGADTGSPVADKDYQPPFRFSGKLDKLTLTIDRPKLSPEDIKKLETAMHSNPASE